MAIRKDIQCPYCLSILRDVIVTPNTYYKWHQKCHCGAILLGQGLDINLDRTLELNRGKELK